MKIKILLYAKEVYISLWRAPFSVSTLNEGCLFVHFGAMEPSVSGFTPAQFGV